MNLNSKLPVTGTLKTTIHRAPKPVQQRLRLEAHHYYKRVATWLMKLIRSR